MVERIITPAFAQPSLFVCAVTSAETPPSPGSDCQTKWKESEVPQMSPPPPEMVQALPDKDWLPVGAAFPMSLQDHPAGQAARPGGGTSLDVIDTLLSVTAEPVPWSWEVIANPASKGWGRLRAVVEPGTAVQVFRRGTCRR